MKGAKIVYLASESKHMLNITGLLPLAVTIAGQATRTTFVIVEELGADVIVGFQYIEAAVDEIYVKKRALVLKSCALVPIQRRCARNQSAAPQLERHKLKQKAKKSLDFVRAW